MRALNVFLGGCLVMVLSAVAAEPASESSNSKKLGAYFERQVTLLEGQLEREVRTKEEWASKKGEYRRQLAEMLGLDPMPPRTDLKAVKTGEFEHEGIIVENLHFQSRPGLYVTANLYRPKQVGTPLPTVLYVCGHSNMMKDGVSYGNKAGYEHHGVWYAKHGFVCLVIDTVQLGEIRGEHHGNYSKGRWWWMARGYTPAGVEAWACIRALDYLETRPEVDKSRFGVAGRSGGGAYSWFIAALDERIQCAVPTAGITTLRNHVVDGCVSGHCDCMYFVNSYGWDYDKLAALVAPRALLVANTDKDGIFPIDGVFRVYQSTRRIYKILGAEAKIGMQFAEGPHKDTQPLNTGEFHWMTRHLQGADLMSTLDAPAVKGIGMEKLRVLSEVPQDEVNTKIDETFVALAATPKVPASADEWATQRNAWLQALQSRCFTGWESLKGGTSKLGAPQVEENDGVQLQFWDLPALVENDPMGSGKLYVLHSAKLKLEDLDLVVLNVLDEEGWQDFTKTFAAAFPQSIVRGDKAVSADDNSYQQEKKMFQNFKWGMAYMCPRGVGANAWPATEKERTHQLRRFYLLGQTLEGQQVWDVRMAIQGLQSLGALQNQKTKLWVQASRHQAANALYASLFESGITRLDLHGLPASHRDGPTYLNVLKYLDLPQAVALAAERTRVIVYADNQAPWQYAHQVSELFQWGKEKKAGLQLRALPVPSKEGK